MAMNGQQPQVIRAPILLVLVALFFLMSRSQKHYHTAKGGIAMPKYHGIDLKTQTGSRDGTMIVFRCQKNMILSSLKILLE